MRIDDEKNQIRGGNGDVHLEGDLFGKAVIERSADAAGIDDFAGKFRHLRRRRKTITGDPRLVVYNRNFPSYNTVKQRGFPHVRATNNSNSGHGANYA